MRSKTSALGVKKIYTILSVVIILAIAGAALFISSLGNELSYTGLTVEQGQRLAIKNGTTLRAVNIDGEPQITTKDYRVGRINASVNDGVISSYSIEGEAKIDYIGLTLKQASALANKRGVPFRYYDVDDKGYGLTDDLIQGRITAEIKKGKVIDYSIE